MAVRSVPIKYLDDITECPICTSALCDPRVLPCIHTFCFKCIKGWADSRKPGEQKLACPLCRNEITATAEHVAQLPKNLFVDKLLEAKRLSANSGSVERKKLTCEMCDAASVATVYCMECQQNMCNRCSASHSKIKVTTSHRLVDIGSQKTKVDGLQVKLSNNSFCTKHRNESMKIFCLKCKTALCTMCFIKDHKSHDCSDISEVVGSLSQQIKADCDTVEKTATGYRQRLEKLSQKEKLLVSKTSKAEQEIIAKCEEMMRAVETRKTELLEELTVAKKKELKEIETVRQELEGRLMMIDSFGTYSHHLRENGSDFDIAREVSGLEPELRSFKR